MYEMQDEHPNEYLRMGEELEETVQEIIAKVEQMRVDYAWLTFSTILDHVEKIHEFALHGQGAGRWGIFVL